MRRKARMKEEIEQKEALGSALNTLARELGVRPGDSYARFVEKAGTDPRLTNIVSESRADYGDVWGGGLGFGWGWLPSLYRGNRGWVEGDGAVSF